MKLKQGDYCEVVWVDATNLHGWNEETIIKEWLVATNTLAKPFTSVGIYLGRDASYFRMAQSYAETSGQWGEVFILPMGWILQIRKLK